MGRLEGGATGQPRPHAATLSLCAALTPLSMSLVRPSRVPDAHSVPADRLIALLPRMGSDRLRAVSRARKDASWPPRVTTQAAACLPPHPRDAAAELRQDSLSRCQVPDLLGLQVKSFDWLLGNEVWQARVEDAAAAGKPIPNKSGLEEIFEEISPIEDFQATMSLTFRDHRFEPPKNSVEECKDRDFTYSAPLFVTAEFMNNETGEIKSQTVFMGDFPLMTNKGTFVINGTERVVVSQLVRSPGRLLRANGRQDVRQGHLLRQDHPVAWCLARVRDRQEGHRQRSRRPQAQAERHRAAQGPGLGRGQDPAKSSGQYESIRQTLEKDNTTTPGRGAARHLPQAASGRAAHA